MIRRALRYMPVLLLGRPWRGPERYRPFFIIGSGRCGSTLLRAILQTHPDVHIPPETPLAFALRSYRRFSRLPWSVLLRIVLTEFEFHPQWEMFELPLGPLFRESVRWPPERRNLAAVLDALYRAHAKAHKPSAICWGDKAPAHSTFLLPLLEAVFPDLRAIHLVRDGRDVVASFARLAPHSFSTWAGHWVQSVRAAQAFGTDHPAQYLEIRYEDLVSTPELIVRKVAAFLDLAFDERMLRHSDSNQWLGDVDRVEYLKGARQPIHQASVGRWREDLSASQIAELDRVLGPMLAALGY